MQLKFALQQQQVSCRYLQSNARACTRITWRDGSAKPKACAKREWYWPVRCQGDGRAPQRPRRLPLRRRRTETCRVERPTHWLDKAKREAGAQSQSVEDGQPDNNNQKALSVVPQQPCGGCSSRSCGPGLCARGAPKRRHPGPEEATSPSGLTSTKSSYSAVSEVT